MISSTWQYKQWVVLSSKNHVCAHAQHTYSYFVDFCCISCGVYQGHSLACSDSCFYFEASHGVLFRAHERLNLVGTWSLFVPVLVLPKTLQEKVRTPAKTRVLSKGSTYPRSRRAYMTKQLVVVNFESFAKSQARFMGNIHLTKLKGNFSGWLSLHFRGFAKLLE